jgi:hypothetical protein
VSARSSHLDPAGPLEVVRNEQTGRNQLGRARLDADGRLRPSLRTRRIESVPEAAGCDFACGEDVMSASDCTQVIAAFEALKSRVVKDDPVDRYWSGRYLWAADIYFTALDIVIKPKRGMFVGFTGGFHQSTP